MATRHGNLKNYRHKPEHEREDVWLPARLLTHTPAYGCSRVGRTICYRVYSTPLPQVACARPTERPRGLLGKGITEANGA